MDRRNALWLLAAGGWSLYRVGLRARTQISGGKPFVHANTDLILDQSGIFGQGHFVAGMLTVTDAAAAIATLKKLRGQTKFACRLRHNSRNRYKVAYAKAAIDYWLDSSPITIRATAIENARAAEVESQTETDYRYIEQIAALADARRPRVPSARVVTQQRYPDARSALLDERLLKIARDLGRVVHIQEGQSDLLQLIGFVTGTIFAAFSGSERRPTNKSKLELSEHLRSRLGAKSLWTAVSHPNLNVRVLPKA